MITYLNNNDIRKPYAVLADIDDTIALKLSDRVLGHLLELNILSKESERYLAGIMRDYKKGLFDNERVGKMALTRCVNDFTGRTHRLLVGHTKDLIKNNPEIIYPYFKDLVELCEVTHDFYLITSNLDVVPQAVCEIFGLRGFASSRSELKDGVFTGGKIDFMLTREDKARAANEIMAGYKKEKSIGLGDSEPDQGIFDAVGIPIALIQESRATPSPFKNAIPHSQVIEFIKSKIL